MRTCILAAIFAAFATASFAAIQQGSNYCYTDCWTDNTGHTHCTSTCNN